VNEREYASLASSRSSHLDPSPVLPTVQGSGVRFRERGESGGGPKYSAIRCHPTSVQAPELGKHGLTEATSEPR
jgi:hypothetical protein